MIIGTSEYFFDCHKYTPFLLKIVDKGLAHIFLVTIDQLRLIFQDEVGVKNTIITMNFIFALIYEISRVLLDLGHIE